jgi:hypothetical protein
MCFILSVYHIHRSESLGVGFDRFFIAAKEVSRVLAHVFGSQSQQ